MEAAFRNPSQSLLSGSTSPVTSRVIRMSAARSAWLTRPMSRLVVNPTMSAEPTVPPAVAPSLPMNLAWYGGEQATRLPGFWAWQPSPIDGRRASVIQGTSLSFTNPAPTYRTERASASFENGVARLSVTDAPFGSLSASVTVDMDKTPYLSVGVPRSDGGWAVKVNPGSASVDTYVQADTHQSGAFLYDLRKATGWSGTRTFRLILFALGTRGDVTHFTGVQFVGASGNVGQLETHDSYWFPHQLTSRVEGPDRIVAADSTVCMPDTHTVAQRLHVSRMRTGTIVLTGELPVGAVSWDAVNKQVLLEGEGFRAAIAISRPVRFLGVYSSAADRLADRPAVRGAPRRAWALALDDLASGDDVVVAASFGLPGEDRDTISRRAQSFATALSFEKGLQECESAWDALLASVPHPLAFSLPAVNPRGADPESIRRSYYRAWVFLLSDSLPAMPEAGFPFPQVCCGKPSLWSEGAPKARFTSQWESVIGMQYLALVDPETAWQAYEGLLSLVSPSGTLAGEGLPTRFAQTALTLVSLTGDRQRLLRIYPALKRLLLWKAADPRWLYKGSTPSDQKDAEFVTHALVDMEYARRIASELRLSEEEAFWRERTRALAADFHAWFWSPDKRRTWRIFRSATGMHEEPDRMWNLQGLALPDTYLLTAERETYLHLYREAIGRGREGLPFLIPELAAFPKYNYTLAGIWRHGTPEEAALMAQAASRDAALGDEFSEGYTQTYPPVAVGVKPSLFGALLAIDCAFWRNGLRMGAGSPLLLPVPGAVGVWNLGVHGGRAGAVFDGRARKLTFQGSALRSLTPPANSAVRILTDGTTQWTVPIPPREGFGLLAATNGNR